MNNKIKTTPTNAILGGISMGVLIIFWLTGCIQEFGAGISSGPVGDLRNAASAKFIFGIFILVAGILAFVNIRVENKVIQIISSIIYALSAFIPTIIEIIDNIGVEEVSTAGVIGDAVIFAIIGILMAIFCILPVFKKRK